jgi:hypothetical protein
LGGKRSFAEVHLGNRLAPTPEALIDLTPQIGGGGIVDQLMDDRLALGDLATFSVDRDEDLLVQRIGQQRM